jgi:hypothetical protein
MGTRKRTKYSRIGARNPEVRNLQFLFAICPPASLREALRAGICYFIRASGKNEGLSDFWNLKICPILSP